MAAKTVTLSFNNQTVTLHPTEDGMFNLNEIARTFGIRQPGQWRGAQRNALNGNANLQARSWVQNNGLTTQSTFATEKGLYAYAMWADPTLKFYDVVLDAFTAAANGDGQAAVETAWQVARAEGKKARKLTVRAIKETAGNTPVFYRVITNELTDIALGETASKIKRTRTIIGKRGKPVKVKSARDVMTEEELTKMTIAESAFAMASRGNGFTKALRKVDEVFNILKSE